MSPIRIMEILGLALEQCVTDRKFKSPLIYLLLQLIPFIRISCVLEELNGGMTKP